MLCSQWILYLQGYEFLLEIGNERIHNQLLLNNLQVISQKYGRNL